MTNFKDIKEAIMYANEHLVSGGFFNNITLTAQPITNQLSTSIVSHTDNQGKKVNIAEHLYNWSLTPIKKERTRLFYLFGDFGSGKSGVCKELITKLYQNYEDNRYGDTMAEPTLPLYLNLRVLTGIYGDFEFANKSLSELIEVMFCVTGIPKVDGDDIIKLVRQYPCVVVFDGFDEAVQKLGKNQQNGFLNKLLSLLPSVQYTKDLMRITRQPVEESTIPDSPSRIVISCRNQLFESKQEQNAFTEAFYNTELSINGFHNYQAYQLDNLPIATIKKSFQQYIHIINKSLPPYQRLDLKHDDSNTFVEYLIDLSINPLLLSLSQSLLPNIKPSLDHAGFINSADMFTELMTKLMQRDSGKGIINIKEKQKILGAIALKMWQQRTSLISLENLRQFFFDYYKNYRQIQLGIDTGRIELETALQDLHSSMIVRDNNDMYFFYHQLIFDYFLAIGIFEAVMQPASNDKMSGLAKLGLNTTPDETVTLVNSLSMDSLIFVSQMVMSFIIRRDLNSYNYFYAEWLTLCEQLANLEELAADTTHNTNTAIKDNNENIAQNKINKARELWDTVIGEDVPESSVLNKSTVY